MYYFCFQYSCVWNSTFVLLEMSCCVQSISSKNPCSCDTYKITDSINIQCMLGRSRSAGLSRLDLMVGSALCQPSSSIIFTGPLSIFIHAWRERHCNIISDYSSRRWYPVLLDMSAWLCAPAPHCRCHPGWVAKNARSWVVPNKAECWDAFLDSIKHLWCLRALILGLAAVMFWSWKYATFAFSNARRHCWGLPDNGRLKMSSMQYRHGEIIDNPGSFIGTCVRMFEANFQGPRARNKRNRLSYVAMHISGGRGEILDTCRWGSWEH